MTHADPPDFSLQPPSDEHVDTLVEEPERWNDKMAQLAAYAADELLAARPQLGEADARRLGVRIAVRLCREVGGITYYWPKSESFDRAARDLAIYAEHDGTVDGPRGIHALARAHKLTEVLIWRIIKRERTRWLERVQGRLL